MATVIRTLSELQDMNLDLDGEYELGNSIDASETSTWNGGAGFEPIGSSTTPFQGKFDGKGYTITGLFINRPTTNYVGLFGYVKCDETYTDVYVKNVTLESVDITGQNHVGGAIGRAITDGSESAKQTYSEIHITGTVEGNDYVGGVFGSISGDWSYDTGSLVDKCTSSCTVTALDDKAGGFVGSVSYLAIERCRASGAVSGDSYVGGFGGDITSWTYSRIRKCGATGNVTCTGTSNAGGFGGAMSGIGDAAANALFEDCYAQGNVSGDQNVGGFVGGLNYLEYFKNCYSTGHVTGNTNVGGFVGYDSSGVYKGCCWDTETSGTETACGSGAVTGVTGYTTEELQSVAVIQGEGWAIGRTWNVTAGCNSGYPCLIGVNPCCVVRMAADPTIAKTRPSLELIRNIEVQCDGRCRSG